MVPERRRTPFRGAAALVATLLLTQVARAESDPRRERLYLTQLALVVDGTRRLMSHCASQALDTDLADLARFARPLAERYVELAERMAPPPKSAVVHPHLLLVVENLERALDAAAASDTPGYVKRVRVAREELLNLEAMLRQLKLRLPEPR